MGPGLTASTKAGGCASKLSPKILDAVLKSVPRIANKNVLVGYDTADDAGVYDLTEIAGKPLAIVQTVDFFTPMVDDPYSFGGVAAANALSDIYAMGGKPLTALSILAYPAKGNLQDLKAILKGGADKVHEAGCVILGGHSISEDEVKFGYAITGTIDPAHVVKNAGACPGDLLVFTKKIGTGVIASALKNGIAREEHVDASIEQMLRLNSKASEMMLACGAHGCTDVTGFGLLGHAREMALASGVTLEISAAAIQYLPGAIEYSRAGAHSAGLRNNREFVQDCVNFAGTLPAEIEALLYDPQTSGGFLISLSKSAAEQLVRNLPESYVLGKVAVRQTKPLEVKM